MPQDLEQIIKSLSPGALRLYKQQIASLPEEKRRLAFSRISGIPELSDIIGQATPITAKPIRQELAQQPQEVPKEETPFWQQALSTATAPFRWIEENVTQPFGAVVTSPWTPKTLGTENLPWFQRELAEYRNWDDPNLGFLGVKGVVETLPWLLVPSAAGVAGRLGSLAAKGATIAAKGGQFAKPAAAIGKGAEVAQKVIKPAVTAEKIINYPIAKPVEMISRKIGQTIKPTAKLAEEVIPPIKPSITTKLTMEPTDDFDKFWKLISGKEGKEGESARQTMMKSARAKQIAKIQTRLNDIDPTKLTESEYTRIWREEAKELYKRNPLGFPDEFLDEGVRRIRQVLLEQNASEFEIKATVTAFKNALAGKGVSRKVGTQYKSAYTRLANVFGKEGVDILANPSRLTKLLAPKGVEEGLATYLRGIEEPLLKPPQKGLIPERPWTPPKSVKGIAEEETTQLQIELANKPVDIASDITDYLLNQVPEEAGKKLMMFPEATRDKVWERLKIIGKNTPDALNIMRATLSSVDISGFLRQGAIATFRHPIEAIKQFTPMLNSMFRPKYAEDIYNMIVRDPDVHKFLKPSLNTQTFIAPLPEKITPLVAKEEAFMSNLAMRIPILGSVIRGSARAFVTGLNLMRYHMMKDVEKGWVSQFNKLGKAATELDYSEMAKLINFSTGRGDLKLLGIDFNRYGGLLNTVLFSPRLFFSRFQWLPMIASPSRSVRIEAWKQIGSFLGAGASFLGAMKLSGQGTVELDPRSADFGKLKVGDTRLDVWTGYSQMLRLLAQLATAQRKTAGGQIQALNRQEIIGRFLQSKLSPAVGLFNDIAKGQIYTGEEFPPTTPLKGLEALYQRAAPLAIQDMVDGFIQSGALGALTASAGLVGVGVVTYMDEAKRTRDKVAQEKYGMSWDEVGRQFGRAEQLKIEQVSPSILKAEQEQEKRFASGTPTTMQHWQNEGKSIEETYRNSANLAAEEYRKTGNGVLFKEKVDSAATTRRQMYMSRSNRKEYSDIVSYYNQPLTQEQIKTMNPGDVLRREHYQQMFGADMYDNFGNYLFDKAAQKEQQFISRYGQSAMDYLEEYQGTRWADKPKELKILEQAREILRPYWAVTDMVWSMYSPALKDMSDQITIMEQNNPEQARKVLKRYPQILRARELIAKYKRNLRDRNPMILSAYRMFYG